MGRNPLQRFPVASRLKDLIERLLHTGAEGPSFSDSELEPLSQDSWVLVRDLQMPALLPIIPVHRRGLVPCRRPTAALSHAEDGSCAIRGVEASAERAEAIPDKRDVV